MQLKKSAREGRQKSKLLDIAGLAQMIQKYSPRNKLPVESQRAQPLFVGR